MKIKSKYAIQEKFSVKPVTVKDVENIIKNIPSNKASGEEIPLNILKQSGFIYDAVISFCAPTHPDPNQLTPTHKKVTPTHTHP